MTEQTEEERYEAALKMIYDLWVSNTVESDDPFEDGYDAGLRVAANIAGHVLGQKP